MINIRALINLFFISGTHLNNIKPVLFTDVKLEDQFWSERLNVNRKTTLSTNYSFLKKQGRIDAWTWKKGKPKQPHIFWDSDVAKWIEAVSYCISIERDKSLENKVDYIVEIMAHAQLDDGYLNSYFINVEPDRKWSNLRNEHELYCAGHLIEAAVAYYQATRKDKFLKVMCKYADHIEKIFGVKRNQKKGYPGHQELELALVKLYKVTGEKKYLYLSKFFLMERGKEPKYFNLERKRFEKKYPDKFYMASAPAKIMETYNQSHKPVFEQKEVVGHAVRAVYMYSGMTDVAKETNDKKLENACKNLWKNLTQKRMYVTGGIGPTHHNEGFTFDYDLPNETAYAETCASIALAQWAHRMFHLDPKSDYMDVLERTIYNGILSGVNLEGNKFFYSNRLSIFPEEIKTNQHGHDIERKPWFECACCPTNIVRFLPSIPGYIYSVSKKDIWVHLYIQSKGNIKLNNSEIVLSQKTEHPWVGKSKIIINNIDQKSFNLKLRQPYWSNGLVIRLNKKSIKTKAQKGYVKIAVPPLKRCAIDIDLGMDVNLISTHPKVRQNNGKLAVQRGPIIYCMEEIDNGKDLHNISLSTNVLRSEKSTLKSYKFVTIKGNGYVYSLKNWNNKLYLRNNISKTEKKKIKMIPYFLWANRKVGEMRIWFNSLY